MAKIIIYEDDERDLIDRYSKLTKEHDVHIRFTQLEEDEIGYRLLERSGFKRENYMNGYGNPQTENADVYFVDGLKGYCFNILEQLPKDKAFLNSDSGWILKQAQEKGLNIVTRSLDAIISEVLSKNSNH